MNIHHFKKNTVITRTERSKNGDGSYMTDPMIFKGVTNGVIHLESGRQLEYPPTFSFDFHKKELSVSEWGEGWDYYKGSRCDVQYKGVRLGLIDWCIGKLQQAKLRAIKASF